MKTRRLSYFTAILLAMWAVPSSAQDDVAPQVCCDDPFPVAELVNSFSCRLTSIIGGTENLFFSPLSLSVTLAMAYLGARGTTAREMEEALSYDQFGNDTSFVHHLFGDKLFALENHTEEYRLLVANTLFAQSGYDVRQEYIDELGVLYMGKVVNLDFSANSVEAMKEINEWACNHTEGKIEKLISEPLDPLTRLVLMNAIYFKGLWKHPFDKKSTTRRDFYLTDGTTKQVPFMEFKRREKYFMDEETNYSFLELDYKGDHISMLVILPNDMGEFPGLSLENNILCRVRSSLRAMTVAVYLPKFRMEYSRELAADMKAMGIEELFSEYKANLTGMRVENDLFASLIVHKAVIEVNEKGTEAAAVSGMSFSSRSGFMQYPIFRADHPFLFCILDKRSGTILFTGRLVNP